MISRVTVRLPSVVTCHLSVSSDTRHKYNPECSTPISSNLSSVTYTAFVASFPVPCFNTNSPLLVVTSLPLCLHCTDSKRVVTGNEVFTSQVSTDDCPTVAFLGVTNTEFCKEPNKYFSDKTSCKGMFT